MSMRRLPRQAAFTLVELLVVIGIIALLIAILLPALNRARQQAVATQCASNMRQIALGMLQYINDNKGVLPPAAVDASFETAVDSAAATNTVWPNGWFWSTELVGQGYIRAPLTTYTQAQATGSEVVSVQRSPFLCPACDNTSDLIPFSNNPSAVTTDPADGGNMQGSSILASNGNPDLNFGNSGVPTWYMPPCTLCGNSNTANGYPDATPFLWFQQNSSSNHGGSGNIANDLNNSNFRRNISQVIHPDKLAMILEGNSTDMLYHTGGSNSLTPRLAARHGDRTSTGYDAYTNIAFFDGHVALFATQPFSEYGWGNTASQPSSITINSVSYSARTSPWPNVAFTLNDQ
ncbi:MAG TPA: prepilin-type N-terminal cleavage/methylation domain-containing protein [Tepidisphaeraceae bacterium]|nr:prepilin-type N-terminal cleavage/methylation domain-containing protein [Tepidisphaeraceae bacterium]